MRAMVQVAIEDSTDAYAAWAAARWRENPRISPSSWRVAQGLTLSKVVFDGRQSMAAWPAAKVAGCNAVLVAAADVAQAAGVDGVAVMAEMGDAAVPACEVAWLRQGQQGRLLELETAVRDGMVGCYGVVLDDVRQLDDWRRAADDVVPTVWGRRKRSGLRALRLEVNPLHAAGWQVPAVCHGEERVSALEWAARLGILVVAEHATCWPLRGRRVDVAAAAGVANPGMLAAWLAVAEAEQRLRAVVAWPDVEGTPLFGVMPFVASGAVPWVGPVAWQQWQAVVWPQVEAAWRDVPAAAAYLAAWRHMLPLGSGLACAGEARVAQALLAAVREQLPAPWQAVTPAALAWGVAASVPAVTAVLGDFSAHDACTSFLQAMERPDIVDIEKVCAGS